jgi:hypothetical protein
VRRNRTTRLAEVRRRLTSLARTASQQKHVAVRSSTRPAQWPPIGDVTDERLAFLAAKPYLVRRSRPWWLPFFRIIEAGGGSAYVADRGMAKVGGGGVLYRRTITAEMRDDRMSEQVLACDTAAQSLSDEERVTLRRTGELPAWFFARIDEEVAKLKQERRHRR